ncbi:MAG TPA: WYL domain-containing protein [Candidatus Avamphibacillus sp.]|nr:WYL domain-containing protein [Candidatus Avamphibacillus sp.]
MERGNGYRLLKLKEILFHETDAMNQLDMEQIISKLKSFSDEKYDKRTIKSDMEALNRVDFEIQENKGKYGKILYSHQARLFETYQLRLIIDAILSARFITTNEKQNLIEKVKQLTSKHIAKTFPGPIMFSQSSNEEYERVKYNIDQVHRAISEKKVLIYQYGRYNVDKEFVYGRDGSFYYVEPYALIWQNDNYYLIGRFQETDEMRHYRLDRIRGAKISEESFVRQEFHLQEYVDQSFMMFAGREIRIKIRFNNELINVVLDRFGLDADIRKDGDNHFILSTKAKLSDGLVNWILTWGDQAKVLSPDYLKSRVKKEVKNLMALYE